MLMTIKIECAYCGVDLMKDKKAVHYVLVKDSIDQVCDDCFKYVFFSNSGFDKVKTQISKKED